MITRLFCIATALAASVLTAPAAQAQDLAAIQAQLQNIQQSLNEVVDSQLVPFTVQAAGGLCDSGPSPSSNPVIAIEGTGNHRFVVTSILIKTAQQPAGQEGYTYLTANSVQIDGTLFDTRTGNLVASSDGSSVNESADLMGMPVRITQPSPLTSVPRTASPSGGNFPLQIVADSAGSNDVRVQLFCRSDTYDLSIATVRVSGWKSPRDTIAVTYTPGV